jgi:hypothetical protein
VLSAFSFQLSAFSFQRAFGFRLSAFSVLSAFSAAADSWADG